MSKNKVRVTLGGSTYFLITDQSEEHIHQAASHVDQIMKDLQHSVGDPSKTAVLTALQLASKLLTLEQQQYDAISEQKRLIQRLETLV